MTGFLASAPFIVSAALSLTILALAVIVVLTGGPDGKPHAPRLPERYPAAPQHRAPKTAARVYGDAVAWLREDPSGAARHEGRHR